MIWQRKLTYMVLGGLLALALAFGAFATFAQTDDEDTAVPEAQTEEESDQVPVWPHFGGRGRHGGFGLRMTDDSQALADALGITLEELQAAQTEARTAAVNQAVADGLITQEQADALLANGLGGHAFHFGLDRDSFLAEALGISVEALQSARLEVYEARLAEMVAAGAITQEQADLMLAQKAVQNYVDTDALQSALQSAYEDAIAQALADGVITQAQADQLRSNLGTGLRGFGLHFGPGFGHHHGRGRGSFGGFFPGFGPYRAPAPSTSGNGA